MDDIGKAVVLQFIAFEQKQAEKLPEMPYPQRDIAAYQSLRTVLQSLARYEDAEVAASINQLIESLNSALSS